MSNNTVSARLYETLCLPHFSSIPEIRKAYKALALQYHPDKNIGNPNALEKFKEVKDAYDVLSNEDRKKRYDAQLRMLIRTMKDRRGGLGGATAAGAGAKSSFTMRSNTPQHKTRRPQPTSTTTATNSATSTKPSTPAPQRPGTGATPAAKPGGGTTTNSATRRNFNSTTSSSGSAGGGAARAGSGRNPNPSSGNASGKASRTQTPLKRQNSNGGRRRSESPVAPPLPRAAKLPPEERLRRLKEAQRLEMERQMELKRQREEAKEGRRRLKEEQEREQERRAQERWQRELEREEEQRRLRAEQLEERRREQQERNELLMSQWKSQLHQSRYQSRGAPRQRRTASLGSERSSRSVSRRSSRSPSAQRNLNLNPSFAGGSTANNSFGSAAFAYQSVNNRFDATRSTSPSSVPGDVHPHLFPSGGRRRQERQQQRQSQRSASSLGIGREDSLGGVSGGYAMGGMPLGSGRSPSVGSAQQEDLPSSTERRRSPRRGEAASASSRSGSNVRSDSRGRDTVSPVRWSCPGSPVSPSSALRSLTVAEAEREIRRHRDRIRQTQEERRRGGAASGGGAAAPRTTAAAAAAAASRVGVAGAAPSDSVEDEEDDAAFIALVRKGEEQLARAQKQYDKKKREVASTAFSGPLNARRRATPVDERPVGPRPVSFAERVGDMEDDEVIGRGDLEEEERIARMRLHRSHLQVLLREKTIQLHAQQHRQQQQQQQQQQQSAPDGLCSSVAARDAETGGAEPDSKNTTSSTSGPPSSLLNTAPPPPVEETERRGSHVFSPHTEGVLAAQEAERCSEELELLLDDEERHRAIILDHHHKVLLPLLVGFETVERRLVLELEWGARGAVAKSESANFYTLRQQEEEERVRKHLAAAAAGRDRQEAEGGGADTGEEVNQYNLLSSPNNNNNNNNNNNSGTGSPLQTGGAPISQANSSSGRSSISNNNNTKQKPTINVSSSSSTTTLGRDELGGGSGGVRRERSGANTDSRDVVNHGEEGDSRRMSTSSCIPLLPPAPYWLKTLQADEEEGRAAVQEEEKAEALALVRRRATERHTLYERLQAAALEGMLAAKNSEIEALKARLQELTASSS